MSSKHVNEADRHMSGVHKMTAAMQPDEFQVLKQGKRCCEMLEFPYVRLGGDRIPLMIARDSYQLI